MILEPDKSLWSHLQQSLGDAVGFNSGTHVAPAALLWPDPDRLWEPTVAAVRTRLPQLLTLGAYQPEQRQGPAIYLRCLIDRHLDGARWPATAVPIVYLPGWGLADLRAIESCPDSLAPIVELIYRGTVWHHTKREWTPVAWCGSGKSGGLGLQVAEDLATAQALRGNLPQFLDRPLKEFQGKRLDAAAIHQLVVPDVVRELLRWLDDAGIAKEPSADEARWQAFRATVIREYHCDPVTDGPLTVAELLAKRLGPWAQVWDRFAENPHMYSRLPKLLRQATAGILALPDSQTLPGFNEQQEDGLRQALTSLTEVNRTEASKRVLALEQTHGPRRGWVWASLGEAKLAQALAPLAKLAQGCQLDLGGVTAQDLATVYREGAWRLDAAARQAMTLVERSEDRQAVSAALRAIYAPWLDNGAQALQTIIAAKGSPAGQQPTTEQAPGEIWLFADGLRFDLAMELADLLTQRGHRVRTDSQWAALPTVTATAKPFASPIAEDLAGAPPGAGFLPMVAATGKDLNTDRFRALLKQRGIQYLSGSECGDPQGMAWAEIGEIDKLGHSNQANLPNSITEQLRLIANRMDDLLAAGWRRVRVITDHGWLWLPCGLPKRNLPKHCTIAQSHWSRCAVLDAGVQVEVPVVHWHWNAEVAIAVAPGAGTFVETTAYSHGGISIQECLTPVIVVEQDAPTSNARLAEWKWHGLRCKVTVHGASGGERIDLRGKANEPASTRLVAGAKGQREPVAVALDGTANIYIEDEHEGKPTVGTSAIIVLLDAGGVVIDKRACEIGG